MNGMVWKTIIDCRWWRTSTTAIICQWMLCAAAVRVSCHHRNSCFSSFVFANNAPSPFQRQPTSDGPKTMDRMIKMMKMTTDEEGRRPEDGSNASTKTDETSHHKIVHHMTICMVPPPPHDDDANFVWRIVSDMRRQLQDPGYYRWPPHVNLLYPFLEVDHNNIAAVLDQLHSATQKMEPFPVRLRRLGTFGGKRRGVLWLSPESADSDDDDYDYDCRYSPLIQLHQHLEEAFPMCRRRPDPTKQQQGGSFTPHMTLSHFETLENALEAQRMIERDYAKDLERLEFNLDRIYLLRRQQGDGHGGQFLRVADIGLGRDGVVEQWDLAAPIRFPFMPMEEEDWVHQARMKLKARRNGKNESKAAISDLEGAKGEEPRRVRDSPEVIAAKRAERKTKRELLELQQDNN